MLGASNAAADKYISKIVLQYKITAFKMFYALKKAVIFYAQLCFPRAPLLLLCIGEPYRKDANTERRDCTEPKRDADSLQAKASPLKVYWGNLLNMLYFLWNRNRLVDDYLHNTLRIHVVKVKISREFLVMRKEGETMFNDYIWQTYLRAGGKDVVEMFKGNLMSNALSEHYIDSICELRARYCPSKTILAESKLQLQELVQDIHEQIGLLENGEYTIHSALEFLYNVIKGKDDYLPQDVFTMFIENIDYYTTFLTIELPDSFVPYYFKCNFNVLEIIARDFEIKLPTIPVKKDYHGRFYYYEYFCEMMLNFRNRQNLSTYELCAFLYDFAPQYIGGTDSYIIKNLPEPKSAYFIGGSTNDKFLTDIANNIICWQCNNDTCAGDMVVMYLKTPVSAVDSIWRSVSVGFNDPFFYYYRCTYISNPIKINRIPRKQIQTDEILGGIPIVRKNMQGINGVELRPSEYNRIVDLGAANVKRLKFALDCGNPEIINEKDVENKLIKPLIKRLGYSDEDYMQQLYIEIGNHNHALIPDFVLLPTTTRGHQSAFAIIEAKHIIPNNKALEETKIQARSYAVLLKAKYSIIASMDKIFVFTPSDDFSKEIFSAAWNELSEADTFSLMYKLLGKKKIKR